MEHWKEIDWSEGCLEVSDEGRIRSNMRDGRILKASQDKKGYLRIHLTINRKRHSLKVHREVARAFLDNPDNLPQVNHKDGDKTNNAVSNLEWISNKDNAQHAIENGLWENVFNASMRSNEARKCPITATNIKSGEILKFESISEAERAIGTKHIVDVIKGKRSQAKGFTFERG